MKQVSIFHKIIATGFGSGYSPVAPGTAGALLATLIWIVAVWYAPFEMVWLGTLVCVLVFTLLGVLSANAVEKIWGKDPSRVVVDEMVGVWIPLLAVPNNSLLYGYAAGAFILFRLFDIFKPLGIRQMERLPGGVGVMMDDILAGVYSWILLMGIRYVTES